jgi:hypothetical protein
LGLFQAARSCHGPTCAELGEGPAFTLDHHRRTLCDGEPMTRLAFIFVAVLTLLTACGADGPPKAPVPESGLTISGQVKVGIAGGS